MILFSTFTTSKISMWKFVVLDDLGWIMIVNYDRISNEDKIIVWDCNTRLEYEIDPILAKLMFYYRNSTTYNYNFQLLISEKIEP
jgi:hypothetical protein